ncbi:hypothetical protein OE88DRAFT_1737432 [Heliocybe sulcata]|uniref:MYND-type domain-containing protein n=1 Tax=Heliocybe sulcata TaxID=5364 RepID=A0A5C3MUE4_9AGAM|nr:hypothetical protein OE88DRAFT_1737432 [Heliocybe sulcata]
MPSIPLLLLHEPARYVEKLAIYGEPSNPRIKTVLDAMHSVEDELALCKDDNSGRWRLLRDGGIISIVRRLTCSGPKGPESPELGLGLLICSLCVRLLVDSSAVEKSTQNHWSAVQDAFKTAVEVTTYSKTSVLTSNGGQASLRGLLGRYLVNLAYLRNEEEPDTVKALPVRSRSPDPLSDEIESAGCRLFDKFVKDCPSVYDVAYHCWLFAFCEDSITELYCLFRMVRLTLESTEWSWKHYDYIHVIGPEMFMGAVCHLLTDISITDECLFDLVDSLSEIVRSPPSCSLLNFPEDMPMLLMDAMWRQVLDNQQERREYHPPCARRANDVMRACLKQSASPLAALSAILTDCQGASMMARIAVECAHDYIDDDHPTPPTIFLVDLFLYYINPRMDDQQAERYDLAKLLRREMEPLWLKTLKHIRTLAAAQPGSSYVIEDWIRLGNVLAMEEREYFRGCFWYMCPLWKEHTDRKMYSCKCDQAQYCDKKCQAADWRIGGHRNKCTHRRDKH